MRIGLSKRFVGLLGVAACAASLAAGGSPSPDDARARAVLQSAIETLGGERRLAERQQWFVEGKGRENLSAELQGIEANRPTWRPHEEKIAADLRELAVAWDRRTPRNDMSVRWRRMIFKADTFGVVDWNGDFGALRKRANPEAYRRAMARRIPHVLLAEVVARGQRLAWSERTLRGAAHDAVEVEMPEARKMTLLFARQPVVLLRAEYLAHLPGRGDVNVAWEWLGWKRSPDLGMAPAGHRVEVNGVTFQEVKYSAYSASMPEATKELLEVPGRFLTPVSLPAHSAPRVAASRAGLPATGTVAPGVVVERVGSFTVMFIEFRDFIVVFEAPEVHPGFETVGDAATASHLTREAVALARKTFPDKPVRYAVISHHHSDHMGGLRAFAAAGATIILAGSDRDAALRLLRAPQTLAPDGWSAEAGKVVIEIVARGRKHTISDGERTLEVFNVGRNPHTTENLLLWLPKERIAMQGDLFYYEEGGPFPPSGRATMNRFFARWLREHKIEPRAVYGVHNNGPAGPEWLQESVKSP